MKIQNGNIIIDRYLSKLDKFTLEFINILKKYSKYVIVSGYVSIILGRARGSEDIDILVSKMNIVTFTNFYNELKKKKFYCLNTTKIEDAYDYLKSSAIRFAKQDTVIPNMEFKFIKNKIESLALKTKIKVILTKNEIYISDLELQVAFKEKVLKSDKDLEDARHIRNIFDLNQDKIKKIELMIDDLF